MNWFTPKRIGILGCVGTAIFLSGFTICKLAGSEPGVSWTTGVLYALIFGGFVVASIVNTKWQVAWIGKRFYGK
jgi:hypothetical protein